MDPAVLVFLFLGLSGVAASLVILHRVSRLRRFVEPGKALIVTGSGPEPQVYFTSAIVFPIRNRFEVMDISLHQIEIVPEVFTTKDGVDVEMRTSFFVHVVKTEQAVRQVAQTIGTELASDRAAVAQLFRARFSDALKVVGRQMEFSELDLHRQGYYDRVVELVGESLLGFRLEDVVIESLKKVEASGQKQ